jgi:dienelactone hydrolase
MVVLAVDYQKNLVPSLVPQTLDFAASLNKAGTPFQGLLDPGRVGMVGHSLGARITARMAGAPLDPNAPPLPQDPRVKAIVLADPDVAYGPANAFDAVKLPAMVMLVTIQAFISLEDGKMVYETLPTKEKSLVVFPHGDHDFIQDPDQPSRYRITDLTCHFTTAFLLATLKSNAQARAALLPGAVHFPEVRYTTAFPGR